MSEQVATRKCGDCEGTGTTANGDSFVSRRCSYCSGTGSPDRKLQWTDYYFNGGVEFAAAQQLEAAMAEKENELGQVLADLNQAELTLKALRTTQAEAVEKARRDTWDAAIGAVQGVINEGKFGHCALARLKDAALAAARNTEASSYKPKENQ